MRNPEQFLERRTFKRIQSNIPVKFYYGNSVYFGTLTNFSDSSMFVSTNKILFPLHSQCEIFIPSINNESLKISAKVIRLADTDGYYNGMGVHLLNVPKDYLAFQESFRHIIKAE